MTRVIEVVTDIGAAPAVVFDLELDVDVHAASLPGSRERASTASGRRRLVLGDEVTFRARHIGLPWRMTSRVTAYDRPHRFVDEQVSGPFRVLHHVHLFETTGGGGTRMTDRMSIAAPGGALGAACTRLLLVPYLRRLLRRRAGRIKSMAESVAPQG